MKIEVTERELLTIRAALLHWAGALTQGEEHVLEHVGTALLDEAAGEVGPNPTPVEPLSADEICDLHDELVEARVL